MKVVLFHQNPERKMLVPCQNQTREDKFLRTDGGSVSSKFSKRNNREDKFPLINPGERSTLSKDSHTKAPSVGELNEIVASIKLSKGSMLNTPNFESTGSISPDDIFFSVDQTTLAMQKNAIVKNNNVTNLHPRPTMFPHMDSVLLQRNKANANINQN
uniref:Uncharacterized protein n=1 Tax=Salix viminalis TaxID=40686 RepID=A0A6N2N3Q5_SALVM